MLSVHRLILEREGPRSLFRGLGPNLVGVAPSRYFFFPLSLKLKFQRLIRGLPFLAPNLTCNDQITERRDTWMLLKNAVLFFFFYPHGFHLGAALMLLLSPTWLLCIRSHFYNLAESYISTQTSGCMQLSVTHPVTLVVSCYNGGVVVLSRVRLCWCRREDVIVVAYLPAAASHEHDCPPLVDFFHFLSVHRGRPLYPCERFTYSVSCAVLFLTSLGCLFLFGSDCVCVWVHVSCRLVAQLWKHQSVLSPWQLEDTQL